MTTTEAGAATEEVVTDHDRGVHGYHKQKDEHLKRLRRIEGQIRGLQRMVEEDTYCIDIGRPARHPDAGGKSTNSVVIRRGPRAPRQPSAPRRCSPG